MNIEHSQAIIDIALNKRIMGDLFSIIGLIVGESLVRARVCVYVFHQLHSYGKPNTLNCTYFLRY